MKRTIAIIAVLAMLFSFSACQGQEIVCTDSTDQKTTENTQQKDQTTPAETQPVAPVDPMEILDKEGEPLGRIDINGRCTAADAGVFYNVFKLAEYQSTAAAEYRFFRAADQKDILLGTLEDQSYEAFYARTELNGIAYALASTGYPLDDEPDTLWLLALDPAAETMTKYAVSEHGFPYAAMSAVNGKLLIMNHEMTEPMCDKIYEFDPAAGTFREVMTYTDESDSLRSVYADESGIYVLRLKLDGGMASELVLDCYDLNYQKISEQPLNDLMIPAALNIHGIVDEADVKNEFGMMVSGFAVVDGRYLFYENFARIRLCIDLESKETLFAQDDIYSMIHGGAWGFHRFVSEDENATEPEILLLKDGKLEQVKVEAAEGLSMIEMMSCSPAGIWILRTPGQDEAAAGKDTLILWKE